MLNLPTERGKEEREGGSSSQAMALPFADQRGWAGCLQERMSVGQGSVGTGEGQEGRPVPGVQYTHHHTQLNTLPSTC